MQKYIDVCRKIAEELTWAADKMERGEKVQFVINMGIENKDDPTMMNGHYITYCRNAFAAHYLSKVVENFDEKEKALVELFLFTDMGQKEAAQ